MLLRWKSVWKSFQAVSENGFIFSFTLLLALKFDHLLSHSWWFVFTPMWWLCLAVVSCGRFSLPAPPMPPGGYWAPPFQYVMATPLHFAFEIMLFLYLEDKYVVDLKLIFLPLLAFEVAILVYNFRKCLTLMPTYEETMCGDETFLMPRDEETMNDEPLLYTWVSIWMVSFIAAITFNLVISRGDVTALDWWDLSINLGIAECFGFLVTKWRNQSIHRDSHISSSFSRDVIYRDQYMSDPACRLLDIGGYVMKLPFITFQIVLFMILEGTPASPKSIPIVVLFLPLLLLQGATVLFVTYISLAKSVSWIYSVGGPYGRSFASSLARVFLRFFQHCKRLLCGWSINKGSDPEEQVRLHSGEATGHNTLFSPEVVMKMPKSDLVEEVCRLKAALSEQTDSQEKNLCKVCFEDPVNVVLVPCGHHSLCSTCSERCKKCPICRKFIKLRLPVYDA